MLRVKRSEIYKYIHNNTEQFLNSYLPIAKDHKSWICPICDKGQHGDGIKLDRSRPGYLHCFSGRHDNGHPEGHFDGDLIDLIAEEYGITDPAEALLKTCEILGIELENDPEYRQGATRSSAAEDFKHLELLENGTIIEHSPKTQETATISEERQKADKHTIKKENAVNSNISNKKAVLDTITLKDQRLKELIEQARSNLEDPRAAAYLKSRGISLDTARACGVGYVKEPVYLFTSERGNPVYLSDSLIFTDNLASFGTRAINPNTFPKSLKAKKDNEKFEDMPYLLRNAVLNKDKRLSDKWTIPAPVFLVEGQLDALSIIEAGGEAISLNGTGNTDKIIDVFKEFEIKRPILLALDTDEAGIKAQKTIYETLEKAGLEVYYSNLLPGEFILTGIKDANDYLRADPAALRLAVEKAKKIPLAAFESGLNKNRKELFKNGIAASVDAPAIPTGFKTLDSSNFLDGGLYEGLYIFGAISSLGKTSLMLQIADQIAAAGHDVLYFSLEMSANELIAKSISRYTAKDLIEAGQDTNFKARTIRGITDGKRYKYYTDPEKEHINKAIDAYFNDTGETMRIIEGIGTIDTDNIRAAVEQHIKYTGRPPVVFIDYLQLLAQRKEPDGRRYSMTDKQIVDANVLALKQLSRDYKMPIFAISSFNRDNYTNSVSMQSFKESGAIEYSSDVLLGMERTDQTEKKEAAIAAREQAEQATGVRHLRLKILKNRNGQTGGQVLLDFYSRFNYFKDAGDEKGANDFKNIILEDFTELKL